MYLASWEVQRRRPRKVHYFTYCSCVAFADKFCALSTDGKGMEAGLGGQPGQATSRLSASSSSSSDSDSSSSSLSSSSSDSSESDAG